MSDRPSWFAVDGSLEQKDFAGDSFFRFPEAVAEFAIERYSRPGDWVLDPFAGFGTTLVGAERLGGHGAGCEFDERRERSQTDDAATPPLQGHNAVCHLILPGIALLPLLRISGAW